MIGNQSLILNSVVQMFLKIIHARLIIVAFFHDMMKIDILSGLLLDVDDPLQRAFAVSHTHRDFPERHKSRVLHAVCEAVLVASEGFDGMSQYQISEFTMQFICLL